MTTQVEVSHHQAFKALQRPDSVKVETIPLVDGSVKKISILSFRNHQHYSRVVECLVNDKPIAFHGWGVSGVCGRIDAESNFSKFWDLKTGRPPGSKVPLLEPPHFATSHIDWDSIHPQYKYLKDPNELNKLWSSRLPFHLIFPYNFKGKSLSKAVITQAYDQDVPSDISVPTFCMFWMADPAVDHLVRKVKNRDSGIQLGVTSLNESGQLPPFNTNDLLAHLRERRIDQYDIVVEDPLIEPINIASSHSQFRVPLVGDEPKFTMIRQGNLSAKGFTRYSGLPVVIADKVKMAARAASVNEDLDGKVLEAARKIRWWYLKTLFHLV